jgi:uncharacterized membrane protein YgcG
MKRAALSLLAGIVIALSFAGSASALSSDVNDFTFESFEADYYLGVDANGRSTLTTVETFVAVFPDFDQNRGMRRAIPGDYRDAPTDVAIKSVTDENGTPRPFTVETDDQGFILVTSKGDGFVQGRQTYVFTYTQNNVTRFFADTNDDEFFWDTNGTGWQQPFGTVTARVHVPSALAGSLTGQNACYRGYEGSTDSCDVVVSEEAGGTVLTVAASEIGPYQNVTVAVGFQPQTFVPRDDSYLGSSLGILQLLAVLGSLLALVWGIVLRATRLADGRGRPTIIAEYSPPKDIDLITASVIMKRTTRAAASQFVDFAVRRRIRIVETETQGFFTRSKTYLLELLDASGLDGTSLNLAIALFGYQLQPGTGYLMTGKDATLSEHVRGIIQVATAAATQAGLRRKPAVGLALLPSLLAIAGATGSFFFGVGMLDQSVGGAIPFLLFIPPVIVVLVIFGLVFRTPLTEAGAELRDHLKGLELYIRLAEADRLQMLQSPKGAERDAISTSDPRQIVDIYEKLLPYAVLFSLEKQWAQELGKYYTEASPDWYSGSGAFNAAIFASSISSMSTSAASSYSGSSSSSSSGGSGGGGSSGGGGGGGGGGGV